MNTIPTTQKEPLPGVAIRAIAIGVMGMLFMVYAAFYNAGAAIERASYDKDVVSAINNSVAVTDKWAGMENTETDVPEIDKLNPIIEEGIEVYIHGTSYGYCVTASNTYKADDEGLVFGSLSNGELFPAEEYVCEDGSIIKASPISG